MRCATCPVDEARLFSAERAPPLPEERPFAFHQVWRFQVSSAPNHSHLHRDQKMAWAAERYDVRALRANPCLPIVSRVLELNMMNARREAELLSRV